MRGLKDSDTQSIHERLQAVRIQILSHENVTGSSVDAEEVGRWVVASKLVHERTNQVLKTVTAIKKHNALDKILYFYLICSR